MNPRRWRGAKDKPTATETAKEPASTDAGRAHVDEEGEDKPMSTGRAHGDERVKESASMNAGRAHVNGRGKDKPMMTETAKKPASADGGRINGWLKVQNPMHVGLANTNGIAASAGPVGRIMALSLNDCGSRGRLCRV